MVKKKTSLAAILIKFDDNLFINWWLITLRRYASAKRNGATFLSSLSLSSPAGGKQSCSGSGRADKVNKEPVVLFNKNSFSQITCTYIEALYYYVYLRKVNSVFESILAHAIGLSNVSMCHGQVHGPRTRLDERSNRCPPCRLI